MEMINFQHVLMAILVGALIAAASWVIVAILGALRDRVAIQDFYATKPSVKHERSRKENAAEAAKIVDEVKDRPRSEL